MMVLSMNPPAESVFPDSSQPRVRLLLVDDMPQVLYDLQQLLELSGKVEVVGAVRDGTQAVHLVKITTPEVILMDLEMPVMDGCEATRRIKSEFPRIRVIILSVHNGPDVRDRSRKAGADGYITKGVPYEVLLKAILSEETTFFEI